MTHIYRSFCMWIEFSVGKAKSIYGISNTYMSSSRLYNKVVKYLWQNLMERKISHILGVSSPWPNTNLGIYMYTYQPHKVNKEIFQLLFKVKQIGLNSWALHVTRQPGWRVNVAKDDPWRHPRQSVQHYNYVLQLWSKSRFHRFILASFYCRTDCCVWTGKLFQKTRYSIDTINSVIHREIL